MKRVSAIVLLKAETATLMVKKQFGKKEGFGMNELLGIAAAVILAAFIVIPGLRKFSTDIITGLTNWWTGSVASKIFPTS